MIFFLPISLPLVVPSNVKGLEWFQRFSIQVLYTDQLTFQEAKQISALMSMTTCVLFNGRHYYTMYKLKDNRMMALTTNPSLHLNGAFFEELQVQKSSSFGHNSFSVSFIFKCQPQIFAVLCPFFFPEDLAFS